MNTRQGFFFFGGAFSLPRKTELSILIYFFYPFMFTTILFFSFLFYMAYIMSCLLFFFFYVFKSGHSMLPDSMPHFLKKTFWQNNKLDKDFFLTSTVVPYGRPPAKLQTGELLFCFNLNPIPSKVNRSVSSEGLNE